MGVFCFWLCFILILLVFIVIERGFLDWLESRDLKLNYLFDWIFFLVDIFVFKGMLFWIVIGVIVCVDLFCIKIVFKIELILLEVLRVFNVFEEVNDNWG